MALTNPWGISEDQIWSPKREREPYREGEKREREKKKKKKRKRRRREGEKFKQAKRYGTNLGMDHMEFVWHSRKV